MGRSLVFTPGCKWEVKSGVLFVDYESMTGEHVRARFDLSPETHYITDGYKLETLRNICEHSDDFFIRRVEYHEIENHMLIGGKMLVPTKVYFEAKAKKTAEEIRNKLLRQVANSAYGITSRDWADVLADSARYIHMQRSRCNGYFDTDMVMTREEMQYCLNDVAIQAKLIAHINGADLDGDTVKRIKLFEEEIKMAEKTRFDMYKPKISKVIFNNPATIVMWSDGTKTVVKCGDGDCFDPEKGVAMCCMKKLLGTNKTGSNYLDKVQEYFNSYIGESVNNVIIGEILGSIFGSKKKPSNSKDIPPEETVEKEFEAVTSAPADENTIAEENGE